MTYEVQRYTKARANQNINLICVNDERMSQNKACLSLENEVIIWSKAVFEECFAEREYLHETREG